MTSLDAEYDLGDAARKVDFPSTLTKITQQKKETLWNRLEKVDHLAYKYWCVLQGSGIIEMIKKIGPVLEK